MLIRRSLDVFTTSKRYNDVFLTSYAVLWVSMVVSKSQLVVSDTFFCVIGEIHTLLFNNFIFGFVVK